MPDTPANPLTLAAPAAAEPAAEPAAGESLPSQAMQEEDEGRGFQPRPSDVTLPNLKEERESQTARTITITLLVMLGVTFLANLITLVVLTLKNRIDAVPHFERMFSIWVPLLSGLVGSAVTFYLTKERK